MEKYELLHMKSNKKVENKNMGIGDEILDLINNRTHVSFDEQDAYFKLHSVIPKYDEYNDIEEAYFIFKDDEPKYNVVIKTKETEILNKIITKHYLDIILKSNTLIYDDKEYKINNIITDITNSYPEIIIECE